jgi:hypothetical protein
VQRHGIGLDRAVALDDTQHGKLDWVPLKQESPDHDADGQDDEREQAELGGLGLHGVSLHPRARAMVWDRNQRRNKTRKGGEMRTLRLGLTSPHF